MLYHLFESLKDSHEFAGSGLFEFLSFRASVAIIISLLISMVFGGRLIKFLQKQQVKETVRQLGLEGEKQKQGTPTMGGLIILAAILIPVLLLSNLTNIYVLLMVFVTITLGLVGFIDDYIKVFKKNKGGLAARFKLIGQFAVGLVVGAVLFFHPDVIIRADVTDTPDKTFYRETDRFVTFDNRGEPQFNVEYRGASTTTMPFIKDYDFDYGSVFSWIGLGDYAERWAWLIYIPMVMLILMFISNGCNLTDGMDGLATGISAIIAFTLGIFAYVSGNSILADYLHILYLPNVGELIVFASALLGACLGFLFFNAYPAQSFMGDTGSLALGGIIASLALIVRKELFIPILCGVFIIENISVMLQVSWFKYTKRKYGEGRRIFKMAPLHHHYQKLGYPEPKIVTRFWIISVLLAVLAFVLSLKVR